MKKAKILIVDNNKDVCRIYEDTLNAAGYFASSIKDEEKALEIIYNEKPDIILLDILMPKISGLHILQRIHKDYHTKEINVIILTEITDSNIKKKAFRYGAKDYIVKSETDMQELLKRIDKVISK